MGQSMIAYRSFRLGGCGLFRSWLSIVGFGLGFCLLYRRSLLSGRGGLCGRSLLRCGLGCSGLLGGSGLWLGLLLYLLGLLCLLRFGLRLLLHWESLLLGSWFDILLRKLDWSRRALGLDEVTLLDPLSYCIIEVSVEVASSFRRDLVVCSNIFLQGLSAKKESSALGLIDSEDVILPATIPFFELQ